MKDIPTDTFIQGMLHGSLLLISSFHQMSRGEAVLPFKTSANSSSCAQNLSALTRKGSVTANVRKKEW